MVRREIPFFLIARYRCQNLAIVLWSFTVAFSGSAHGEATAVACNDVIN